MTNGDKPKRRKMTTEPGRDYSAEQYNVAVKLRNFYSLERARHLATRSLQTKRYQPVRFEQDLGVIDKPKDHENIEDDSNRAKSIDRHWLKLASAVIENGVDPEQFIRAQFDALDSCDTVPKANQLNTEKGWERYYAGSQIGEEAIVQGFTNQVSALKTDVKYEANAYEISEDEAALGVLSDTSNQYTALFRYCVSGKFYQNTKDSRFLKVAKTHKPTAAVEYIRNPEAYQKAYGKLIPSKFINSARTLVNSFYAVNG